MNINKNLTAKDFFLDKKNDLVLITNNDFTKDLTINILDKYKKFKSFNFKIMDIKKNIIINFDDDSVTTKCNASYINNFIDNYNIFSYPIILVLKSNKLIEEINCSYDNIMEILSYYI